MTRNLEKPSSRLPPRKDQRSGLVYRSELLRVRCRALPADWSPSQPPLPGVPEIRAAI
jgi:hypothetical protein